MSVYHAWLLASLRRYAVPVLLLLYLAGKLLAALVVGDAPQPQIPPDGYVCRRPTVQLSWHRSDSPAGFRLQVVKGGGDFDAPLVDRVVRGSFYTLRDVEGGQTYRWRVIEEKSGRASSVASFRTAPYLIAF